MLNIGNRLECFFDQELLDMNATDAEVRLHQPVRREVSMVHDAEWEGDMSNYHCILNDDGLTVCTISGGDIVETRLLSVTRKVVTAYTG